MFCISIILVLRRTSSVVSEVLEMFLSVLPKNFVLEILFYYLDKLKFFFMLLTNWLFYYKLKCPFCKEFFLKHLFFYSVVMCIFSFKFVLALDFPYFEWNLANYNGAYATFNKGLVSIANGGSDYWHVQLTRNNIDLQAGKTYY